MWAAALAELSTKRTVTVTLPRASRRPTATSMSGSSPCVYWKPSGSNTVFRATYTHGQGEVYNIQCSYEDLSFGNSGGNASAAVMEMSREWIGVCEVSQLAPNKTVHTVRSTFSDLLLALGVPFQSNIPIRRQT